MRRQAEVRCFVPWIESDRPAELAAISNAIQHRDWPALQQVADKLSDLLFYLED